MPVDGAVGVPLIGPEQIGRRRVDAGRAVIAEIRRGDAGVLEDGCALAANPDYTISMDDIRSWEGRHGPIPEGAFVAMRTGWSLRWPDPVAMRNADEDDIAHFPGWSLEVLKYLCEERQIAGLGHETTDTDGGIATSKGDYSLETYVLSQDKYQIELLANLDEVPESGAVVVVAFPKPKGGSGFPARVFAILP